MSKLRVDVVGRDEQGQELSREKLKKMAVLMPGNVAEVIDTDLVDIRAFLYDKDVGVLRIEFHLGGEDSAGRFREDPEYESAHIGINRKRNTALWNSLSLDDRQVFDLNELRRFIHERGAITKTALNVWKIPNLESTLES